MGIGRAALWLFLFVCCACVCVIFILPCVFNLQAVWVGRGAHRGMMKCGGWREGVEEEEKTDSRATLENEPMLGPLLPSFTPLSPDDAAPPGPSPGDGLDLSGAEAAMEGQVSMRRRRTEERRASVLSFLDHPLSHLSPFPKHSNSSPPSRTTCGMPCPWAPARAAVLAWAPTTAAAAAAARPTWRKR